MNTIKRKSLRLLGRTKSLDLKALGRELTLDPYKVDLTEKKIGDEGLKQLANLLSSHMMVKTLELFGNDLTDESISSLIEIMRANNSINSLKLEFNLITERGATELAEFLMENKSLTLLDFYGNPIRDEGAKAIADALKKNTTLQTLGLFDCKITNWGAAHLCKALQSNHHIKSINLDNNDIDDELIEVIEKIISRNSGEQIETPDLPWKYEQLLQKESPVVPVAERKENKKHIRAYNEFRVSSNSFTALDPLKVANDPVWEKERQELMVELENLRQKVEMLEQKNFYLKKIKRLLEDNDKLQKFLNIVFEDVEEIKQKM